MATNKKQIKILEEYQGFQPNDICEIVYTKPKSDDPNDGWHTVVLVGTKKSSVVDMDHEGDVWVFIDPIEQINQKIEDVAKTEYPIMYSESYIEKMGGNYKKTMSVMNTVQICRQEGFIKGAEYQMEKSFEFMKWANLNNYTLSSEGWIQDTDSQPISDHELYIQWLYDTKQ